LAIGHARGRGAQVNPPNRFEPVRLSVLGETLDEAAREHPEGRQVQTVVLADRARTIINPVDSPDVGMKWTINPYRGCEHGCVYCYARPTHETFGLSCGLDFETRLFAKQDAPALLRRELASPKWRGEGITMSGITDPYQPIERRLGITRACLEVMAECGQPVSIITKSRLVTRDIDLLGSLAARHAAAVFISLTTLDPELSARMEPRASSPRDRLKAMEDLAAAGIPVGVMTAPIVPGLTDQEIPALIEAAAKAGATRAGWVMLRLPWQIKDVFLEWARREFPERAGKIESRIREMRGGKLYDPRATIRQRGEGAFAEQIASLHAMACRRHRMNNDRLELSSEAFQRPVVNGQLGLFG
jgi:DNA repair photolyase